MSHQMTLDLGYYEIRKYQKNPKISYIYSLVPSLLPKIKMLPILTKNCWKKKLIKLEFVSSFLWMVVVYHRISIYQYE